MRTFIITEAGSALVTACAAAVAAYEEFISVSELAEEVGLDSFNNHRTGKGEVIDMFNDYGVSAQDEEFEADPDGSSFSEVELNAVIQYALDNGYIKEI